MLVNPLMEKYFIGNNSNDLIGGLGYTEKLVKKLRERKKIKINKYDCEFAIWYNINFYSKYYFIKYKNSFIIWKLII